MKNKDLKSYLLTDLKKIYTITVIQTHPEIAFKLSIQNITKTISNKTFDWILAKIILILLLKHYILINASNYCYIFLNLIHLVSIVHTNRQKITINLFYVAYSIKYYFSKDLKSKFTLNITNT